MNQEILQQTGPICGMVDFGVELYRVGFLPFDLIGRVVDVLGAGDHLVIGGQFDDGVAVGHPDLAPFADPVEELVGMVQERQVSPSILP